MNLEAWKRRARQLSAEAYTLYLAAYVELVGTLPGPPLRSLVTASTPSSTPSKTVESWTWASVSTAASGTPLQSTISIAMG